MVRRYNYNPSTEWSLWQSLSCLIPWEHLLLSEASREWKKGWCTIPRCARKKFGFQHCHTGAQGGRCAYILSLWPQTTVYLIFFIPACNDLSFFLLFYCMEKSQRGFPPHSVQGESTDPPFCWEVVVPVHHGNKNAGCGSVRQPVINDIKVIYLPAYIVTLISSWSHFFTFSFPEEHCSDCSQVGFLPAAPCRAGCNLCWVSPSTKLPHPVPC